MPTLLVDLSHHNATPDFPAMKAGGVPGIIAKASEGVGWTDPAFAAYRAGAAAADMVFGAYHFARLGDPHAEAAYFLSVVQPLRAGDLLALDLEVSAPGVDPVAWSLAWLQQVHAATGVHPLIYLNQSTLAAHDWRPLVADNDGLWLAKYDGAPTGGSVGPWPCLAVKQFTDHATVPGAAGQVDEDAFQGGLAQLAAYGYQPTAAAAPAPAPRPTPPPPPPFDTTRWVLGWRTQRGATGQVFVHLQNWANQTFGAYQSTPIRPTAPSYGPQTQAFLREFCRRAATDRSYPGNHGDLAHADGANIGNDTAAALAHYGFPAYLARAGFRG